MVITGFQLANKSAPIGGDSILQQSILDVRRLVPSHEDHIFSFLFDALKFRLLKKNRYELRSDSFEGDCNEVDIIRRLAT